MNDEPVQPVQKPASTPDFADEQPAGGSRGEAARMALLRAGIEEFGEYGAEGASIRKIAARAGQNVAAIAYYYGSKQGLYLAIARYIGERVLNGMGTLLDDAEAFLGRSRRPPAQCLSYLQRILASILSRNDEMSALSQFIVREQTHPTEAFEVLYRTVLERQHCVGTNLIAAYAGQEPTQDHVVLYHLLLGSVLGFRTARQTLLHRLGRTDFISYDTPDIEAHVARHIEVVLRDVRRAGASGKSPPEPSGEV